ncbi:MAG: sigma-70 family RNA polymerase sigma factor [Phycisphaerae bacterium]|nr:sigma-70 family RNA polymerase sigma factor [Phycisphaerae bacterium]
MVGCHTLQTARPEKDVQAGSTESDANLVVAVGAGDMSALGELVDRHQQKIMLFAYRTLGRWDLAEDVAQDVFLRVHRSAARYKPTANVTTWLYRIAANLSLDAIRRDKRGPVSIADDADLSVPARGDTLEARERVDMVRQAVAALPDRQRVVVNLHRYEGLSHQEITETTGWSQSAVESLLVRAYANLRESLSGLREP